MGVPIVTRVGDRPVARTGLSILAQLDMSGLAATTSEQYIKTALALATNRPALARIRAGLRQRMQDSTLCQHETYVMQLERVYRDLWRRTCSTSKPRVAATVGRPAS
jgi:predicted O-linked N-acetylglucosamine transferase (SPINDLY family)